MQGLLYTVLGKKREVPKFAALGLIKCITISVFSFHPGLKRLLLHSNQIEYLTRESLAGLTDMDYLVLDFNPIKHISGDAFFSLKNLKTLHLTRTGLTTLGMLIR